MVSMGLEEFLLGVGKFKEWRRIVFNQEILIEGEVRTLEFDTDL